LSGYEKTDYQIMNRFGPYFSKQARRSQDHLRQTCIMDPVYSSPPGRASTDFFLDLLFIFAFILLTPVQGLTI